jgi:DNA-directed RNA polymerase specialized sigma subunit
MRVATTLTPEQAWEVYQLAWHTELPHAEIAAMYGVQQAAVSAIKHGHTWGFQPVWQPPDSVA